MPKPLNRLSSENISFTIGVEGRADHAITVNIGGDNAGHILEIAFVEGGKIGHGLHLLLSDLGIKLSRALQNRDPQTGAELLSSIDAGAKG